MNRTLLITTAALVAAFVQPVYAKKEGKAGKEGRTDGGGSSARAEVRMDRGPSMNVQKAPRSEVRMEKAPRVTQSQSFSTRSMRSAPEVKQRATITKNRSFDNRSFEQRNRQSPTIAFGGSTVVNRNTNVDRERSFENTRVRRDFDRDDRRLRPPSEVWRNWDRRHIHTWNNYRYRWYNNDWVILTYGDPFYSSSHYPTNYYSDSYYDVPETTTFTYSTTDGLASAVQSELARRGYNPGVIDGVIGPQTRSAIARFQSDEGLPVTGRIDRALLGELNLD